jgi:hypothetical protein
MTPDPPATSAHGLTPRSFLGLRSQDTGSVALHGIGGRRDLPLPFKLIVAGSAAAGHRMAGGAPGHADDDQGGRPAHLRRHAGDGTPSKPSQLPYRLNPRATRKADLSARPTVINTAAPRLPDRTSLRVLRDCGDGHRLRGADNPRFTSRRHAEDLSLVATGKGPTPLTVDDERGEEWTLEAKRA